MHSNSKMKILLIDPYQKPPGPPPPKKPSPNLGIAYLAAYVKDIPEASVEIIDMQAYDLDVQDVCKHIGNKQPNIIGISAKTVNVNAAYKIFDYAKNNNADVVNLLGGAHGTALPEYTLRECESIDCIVLGEGEITFREIIVRIMRGLDKQHVFEEVDGIAYRTANNEPAITPPREPVQDLDIIPMPDYRLYEMDKYDKIYDPVKHRFERVFSICASRGCPFGCKFCMPLLGHKIRRRSPSKIVEEIRLLRKQYQMRRFYLEDSTATADKAWFMDICEQIITSGLSSKLKWGFESRVDLVDKELFVKARKAGCTYVYFGMESGSNEILKQMSKGITREKIIEAVSTARIAKIATVAGSFIFGFPHEKANTIAESIELIECLQLNVVNLNIIDVYPGTALFDMVDNNIGGAVWLEGKRMNWDSYDRKECQIAVGDLCENDFKNAIAQARSAVQEQWRRRKLSDYLLKVFAYTVHYISKPSMILYYAKKQISSKRT